MSFLFKLTIAILIVFAILFPILISSDNKLSALFWKIPKDFWVFLIIMYGAIITVVFIESSEQARIRRQQYLQQYKMPNEIPVPQCRDHSHNRLLHTKYSEPQPLPQAQHP